MNKGDLLVERGADRLEELSRKAAAKGGFAAKLADELAENAEFLRKLKPSLIKARARANSGSDQSTEADAHPDGAVTAAPEVAAPPPTQPPTPEAAAPPPRAARVRPPRPQPPAEPKRGRRGKGPNPFLVAGAALVAGIVLAKVIDWRSHAHPRD
jgi:hypothetical protein